MENTSSFTSPIGAVGINGFNKHNESIRFVEGAFYRHINIFPKGAKECQFPIWLKNKLRNNYHMLEDVVCISLAANQAVFMPQEFKSITLRGNIAYGYFETSSGKWSIKEYVMGYDVPLRIDGIDGKNLGLYINIKIK